MGILYWFFAGLLIYSLFVALLTYICFSCASEYPPSWKRFYVLYIDIGLFLFKLLSPRFRKSFNYSVRPMTEEERKEAE